VENIIGGSGNDYLIGSGGPNRLEGRGGDDWLDGRGGADDLIGGSGVDTVTYHARAAAVRASIDGIPDDGNASDQDPDTGRRDNVHIDVENLLGGAGNDTLIGSPANNLLDGRQGDDLLDGRAGADIMFGRSGTDTVTYAGRSAGVTATMDYLPNDGNASDQDPLTGDRDNIRGDVENIIGGDGDDTLIGNGEANRLDGGPGVDRLDGRGGDDVIVADDGIADQEIRCGSGHDIAFVDPVDPVVLTGPDACEDVRIREE
jgi:Ca2+-binding RTX toxin-like protein